MIAKFKRNISKYQWGWVIALHLCSPISSFAVLFQVDQISEPTGFILQSSALEQGVTFPSVNPTLSSNGYTFGYWTINGVRKTAPDGRSLTQVSSVINTTSTYKAYYFATAADTDTDGILDWFEYRMFGNLDRKPDDDSDGDGFPNKRESELGQDPLIIDQLEDGGISSRLSSGFVYADTSMVLATIKSNPDGFVSEINNFLEINSTLSTSNLHGANNGYHFAYWAVNGVRQSSPTGVASSKVDIDINSTSEVVAYFIPSTQDTDGDGVMDWFELYQFGNLNSGPNDDSDEDGFSNKREGELGQEATIVDQVEDGGIASRLSSGFVYADSSMLLATVKSDPTGFITESSNFLETNASLSTTSLHGESNGYHFAYWSVNGVRQSGPTGVSKSKVNLGVTEATEIVAHFLPSTQDNDGDGVMDWFELYQFGDFNKGPTDDSDGDGYSNKWEDKLGQEATIHDLIEDGGIASRNSVGVLYFLQINKPPNGLELSNSYVLSDIPAGELVGTFIPSDPNHYRGNIYQLAFLDGNGSTDREKFSISGMNLVTATSLSLGNYSINVRVTDNENASFDQNFTISAIDPDQDIDNDGLSYGQELALGTSDQNPDSDGDGYSDLAEYNFGSDPTDANSIANAPPSDLNNSTTLNFFENQPIGTIVAEFNATDPDANSTLTYHLVAGNSDNNNSLFTLETNGTLKTATNFDYESNASTYSIRVQVKDEHNASMEGSFTVTLLNTNEPPVIENLPDTLILEDNVAENSTFVLEINASDPEGNFLSFQKTGGLDQNIFNLNASSGRLTFQSPPDFENPQDVDSNNTYEIWFRANDGLGGFTEKRLTVSVTNVIEDNDGDGIEDAHDTDDDNDGFSDLVEIAFGSNPMDANSVANSPPTELQASTHLSVLENQPIGTFVGQFHATDPDVNSTLSFSLEDYNQTNNSPSFILESNGSLYTNTIFDFESNNSKMFVRIQVLDEFNASLQKTFAISIIDTLAPYVQTMPAKYDKNDVITLQATVEQNNDLPIISSGFQLSESTLFTDFTSWDNSHGNESNFSVEIPLTELQAENKYFFRAFAQNAEGISLGSMQSFITPPLPTTSEPWWNTDSEIAGGWRNSSWFGTFLPYPQGWIYHIDLGWLFTHSGETGDLWLWSNELGWLWSGPGVYPYLFQNSTANWLYFLAKREGKPLFYDYTTKSVK